MTTRTASETNAIRGWHGVLVLLYQVCMYSGYVRNKKPVPSFGSNFDSKQRRILRACGISGSEQGYPSCLFHGHGRGALARGGSLAIDVQYLPAVVILSYLTFIQNSAAWKRTSIGMALASGSGFYTANFANQVYPQKTSRV